MTHAEAGVMAERAYAALAIVYIRSVGRHWVGNLGLTRLEARAEAFRNVQKALLQPNALARQATGYIQLDNKSANEGSPSAWTRECGSFERSGHHG
jgi:hypothetical protein